MLLLFDIGNTHTVIAISDKNGDIKANSRISTNEQMTEDELYIHIKNLTDYYKISIESISGIVASSVVPHLITICNFFGKKYFDLEPLIIDIDLKLPFGFSKKVNTVGFGADRIINIAQAIKQYPNKDLIVFDLGTATTYEVIKDGLYIGGGIIPGINMSIAALFSNTAKLPKVKFSRPDSVIGCNTVEQIKSGIFYGYAGQLKFIISKIKEEVNNPYVIATGGLGKILSKEINEIDEYVGDLSIKGLHYLYELNKGEGKC